MDRDAERREVEERIAGPAPRGPGRSASRCPSCQGYTHRPPHRPEMCVFILSKRLRESERERAIALGTVAWLRRRLGEPDED